jgi:propanol-preferring alcohol dehydrogenase
MKAMLLHNTAAIETSPLVWSDVPDPTPAAGEVRVKVHCCAICRTDLHVIEGDLPPMKRPIIPGHQIVGVIDRLGSGCKRFKAGARVGVAWLRHTCGVCRFCTTGRENLCELSQYTGYHADGGYAEYALADEEYVYELPEGYDDIPAAPMLCAGIIGYRAFKRCQLRDGATLGLFGFGSSAHIVLTMARRLGHKVYVVTRGEAHQELARELGAVWCGENAQELPTRLDGAIIFAPAGGVVPVALAALDRGGVVTLAGIHMSPIPSIDYDKLLFGERDIHPVTANTRDDGRELLAEGAAAGDGRLKRETRFRDGDWNDGDWSYSRCQRYGKINRYGIDLIHFR